MEVIRRGSLFDVFRDGSWAVKRVSSAPPEQRLRSLAVTYTHSNETNIFVTRDFGWERAGEDAPTAAHYGALLVAEQRVIERAASEWNHPGARIVDGALVSPWCDGRSFATLSRDEQRRSFPRMVPALWAALAACPHGDLKPDSFMLEHGDWFRILDPGVSVGGPTRRRDRPGGLDLSSSLMTTNAAHYPLLAPETGPNPPVRRASVSLVQHLRAEAEPAPHFEDGTAPISKVEAPSAADTLALGAMYFAILTGSSLAGALAIERPLWCRFWSDSGRGRPVDAITPVIARLDAGVLEDALARAGAAAVETRLCVRLVRQGVDCDELLG